MLVLCTLLQVKCYPNGFSLCKVHLQLWFCERCDDLKKPQYVSSVSKPFLHDEVTGGTVDSLQNFCRNIWTFYKFLRDVPLQRVPSVWRSEEPQMIFPLFTVKAFTMHMFLNNFLVVYVSPLQ